MNDMNEATVSLDNHDPKPSFPSANFPGGFEIFEEIGRGGMGVVYRARDLSLDREVAVKMLQEKYAPESGAARRFLDEARITGQLQHPGVPAVYQVGTLSTGRPYLAMKLIKGDTLDAKIKSGSVIDVYGIFEAIARTVGYAHAHGVIHRDLKPANVMVGAYGEVQVMDWGLAKVLQSGGGQPPAQPRTEPEITTAPTEIRSFRESDGSFTQSGSILGTPAYSSPEQAAGELDKINARSDVFGLGAILCVMITGKPPFSGDTSESVRLNAVRGKMDEALSRLNNKDADPDLVAMCRRCIAVDPCDRPANANEVAEEISSLRRASEERVKQAELAQARAEVQVIEQKRRKRIWQGLIVTLMIGLLAAISMGLWANHARGQAELAMRAEAVALEEAKKKEVKAHEEERRAKLAHEAEVIQRQRVEGIIRQVTDMLTEIATLAAELQHSGNIQASLPLYERLTSQTRNFLGESHPVSFGASRSLAKAYAAVGRLADAVKLFENILHLKTKILGSDHPDTLQSAQDLATCFLQMGHHAKVLPLLENNLKQLRQLNSHSAQTINALNNLASSYYTLNRTKEALDLHEESLRLASSTYGKDHPDTLIAMHNLASSYSINGRINEATQLNEEVLKTQKAKLGVGHADTLRTINSLALNYSDQGKKEHALKLYEEALRTSKERLGPNHPQTLVTMNNMGLCLTDLGKWEAAIKMHEEAVRLREGVYGGRHPMINSGLFNLACSYAQLAESLKDRPIEAKNAENQALQALSKAINNGFKNRSQIESNPALKVIRQRPELQKLLSGMPVEQKPK